MEMPRWKTRMRFKMGVYPARHSESCTADAGHEGENGETAHCGDAAVEDEDAVGDGRCAGSLSLVVGPVALHEPPVHVLPVHLHRAVELHRNRKTSIRKARNMLLLTDTLPYTDHGSFAALLAGLPMSMSLKLLCCSYMTQGDLLAPQMIRDPADGATFILRLSP